MAFVFPDPVSFEWDSGNSGKNLKKHGVGDSECEEAFFDSRKKILTDTLHSGKEERYVLLGKTKEEKLLFIVFTIRRNAIRVISARRVNRKEIKLYE